MKTEELKMKANNLRENFLEFADIIGDVILDVNNFDFADPVEVERIKRFKAYEESLKGSS